MASQHAPRRQRAIQKQVALADKAHPKSETKQAMQAGGRPYPAPPFPKQHQSEPGSEAELNLVYVLVAISSQRTRQPSR